MGLTRVETIVSLRSASYTIGLTRVNAIVSLRPAS